MNAGGNQPLFMYPAAGWVSPQTARELRVLLRRLDVLHRGMVIRSYWIARSSFFVQSVVSDEVFAHAHDEL